VEVTAQILDALAFLFVTPEFLGEQTLASIRDQFHIIVAFVHALLRTKIAIIGVVCTFLLSFIPLFLTLHYTIYSRAALDALFTTARNPDVIQYVGYRLYAEESRSRGYGWQHHFHRHGYPNNNFLYRLSDGYCVFGDG
jgi:hypothetical protein